MNTAFGKFRLLQRIGGGRLSQVFRVSRGWGERVPGAHLGAPPIVLKRVAPALIGESAFVQLVTREAGLLSRLNHPNLCTALEMGVIDGCAFLTLDMVDGCTLRALLRRVSRMRIRLPTSAVLALVHQLAEVLDYLHRSQERPLVHLDLSPQNVMISRGGEVKLIDFGIARYLDGGDPPPLGGRIAGTIGYMSPEQARGEGGLDARADQFALGILLWEMLSGRRLFPGNTADSWDRMRRGSIPPLRGPGSEVSPELWTVIERATETDSGRRYANLEEMIAALEGVSAGLRSGRRPLAALTTRLMGERDFDPYDAVSALPKAQAPTLGNIPTGEVSLEDYAELAISVDHGDGTPSAQMRAAVPADGGGHEKVPALSEPQPDSPFLENSSSFELDLAAP